MGVFQAAYRLQDSGDLAEHELLVLKDAMDWLDEHLEPPACLEKTANAAAICWFRPEAKRPIEKVRAIAALLEEHGWIVRMVKTDRPGKVIYEDGWQVVAKPWRR